MQQNVSVNGFHYISLFNIENSPLSKLLVLASGAVTVNYLLMPKEYSTLLHLHWPLVSVRKEVGIHFLTFECR